MVRLFVWIVKLALGVAQFAFLNRLADHTGFRNIWLHPIAHSLSLASRLDEGYLEILILAAFSCWLVWMLSALCGCFTAALGRVSIAGLGAPRESRRPGSGG